MALENPVKSDFAVICQKRVRYHEVDLQNIVFNANYLTYADIAVTEYFRAFNIFHGHKGELFADMFGNGGDVMVRHSELDFRASARADDMLDMGINISHFGNSSFTMQIGIYRGDELLNLVTTRYVHFMPATGKTERVPDEFREKVLKFQNMENA